MSENAKVAPYSVNLWGSHPDEENDDCWTGIDFESLEAAKAWLDAPVFGPPFFKNDYGHASTAYLQLVREADADGCGGEEIEVRKNPLYDEGAARRRRRAEDAADRREAQMQSALAFGVQGWNDYEGC
jgi:hypothetical protein